MFYPVCHPEALAVGDIVFCDLGLHPRYFRFCARMIMAVKVVDRYWNYNTHKYEERRYFRIGTTHAGVDGHAWEYMVHSKRIKVVGIRDSSRAGCISLIGVLGHVHTSNAKPVGSTCYTVLI